MIRVYTASKLSRANLWRELDRDWPFVFFHARWIKHNNVGTPDTKEHAVRFWVEDEEDVKSADVVVVWAEGNEHLRGALVEAGIAIANQIPVLVIGDHPDYGTWQFHPGVHSAADIEDAGEWLANFARARCTPSSKTETKPTSAPS